MFKMIKRMSFVIGIILVLILSFSYGTFIYTSDSYRTTEMLVSNLTYGIDITSSDATISGKTVSVSSGTTAVVYLKVTSLNKVDTKYGVDYKITKGTGTVKYASNTGWLPTGKISENNVGTYEKVVKVVIAAETDMSVDFTVTGGFTNNELTEVETGYTRITEKADNVISYNDTLTNVVKKETTNNIYGGESTNNYAQYPINEDNTKNIWRILGTYNGIGTKIVLNQISTTTKSTLSTDLTSFYNTLEKPDNYILSTDKFACINTSCTSSSYSKVGLISTSEYEMLGGINSYLASSESYFALDNGTIKNITSGGIEETSTTSGLRPAVYLQDYVTVTGSGTVSDPFKLKMPEYAVVLNVVNGSTALPSKMITRGENATYEITPNTGYKLVLSSNTCSNGTLEGNVFTITNVTSAQSCTITLTPESYTLTLDTNGGSVSTTSKTVTYDSTYGELPTPTRTGYTFNGWYKPEISSSFTLEPVSSDYQNLTILSYSTPGQTYKIAIGNAKVTSGSATAFTTRIFDDTLQTSLNVYENDFGSNINYSVDVPSSATYSNNIRLIIYSGLMSNTANVGTTFDNVNVYTTNNRITSSSKVQTSSNHKLIADWTANTYSVTLNVTNGTGSSTKTVAYGNSATFTVSPNSGYKLELETNTCGGTLSGNTYTISNITSGKSCSITFKSSTPTLYDKLLADKITRPGARTDFSTVLTTDNTNTLYTSTEDSKTVYYFAGNATDNWVKFGKNASNQDLYWRIIRTNSDGSVRLLYHGTSTTAEKAYIGEASFNIIRDNIAYVSYMYGSLGSIPNARTNQKNSSSIKTMIDNWYKDNLNTSYGKYLSTTAIYCNDRTYRVDGSITNFGARTRLDTNKTPSYDCAATEDKFTVDSTVGNGKLTYPIALMTADEVSFAGGVMYTNAPTWYFYNSANGSSTGSTWWWLLSPHYWDGFITSVFLVGGSSNSGYLSNSYGNNAYGVRPAISLKSCTLYSTGNGSASDPYTIEETTSGC